MRRNEHAPGGNYLSAAKGQGHPERPWRRFQAGTLDRRQFLAVGAGSLAVAVLPQGTVTAKETGSPAREIAYRVIRDGGDVGRYRLWIAQGDAGVTVRSDMNVAVRFLGLTLYRYRMQAEEFWTDNRLAALTSHTNDNGKIRNVTAAASGDVLMLTKDGKNMTVPGDVGTTSFWRADTPYRDNLLDIAKGRVRKVHGTPLGRKKVKFGDVSVWARHYAIAGQIKRELWYDDDFCLVRAQALDKYGVMTAIEAIRYSSLNSIPTQELGPQPGVEATIPRGQTGK